MLSAFLNVLYIRSLFYMRLTCIIILLFISAEAAAFCCINRSSSQVQQHTWSAIEEEITSTDQLPFEIGQKEEKTCMCLDSFKSKESCLNLIYVHPAKIFTDPVPSEISPPPDLLL